MEIVTHTKTFKSINMHVIILVYLIFLSLNDIDSSPFNQTTEETTEENVLNDTQMESTGIELTDKARKY